jgi:hypothetical protein
LSSIKTPLIEEKSMKLMKKAVAVALMTLFTSGMIACEQKQEKTEAVPAEKAAPMVEEKAPAAEVQAPAEEVQPPAAEEAQPPAAVEGTADVPSPDSEAQPEEAPAAPEAEHK